MLFHIYIAFDPARWTGLVDAENPLRDIFLTDQARRQVEHQRCFQFTRMTHAAGFGLLQGLDEIRHQVPVGQRVHSETQLYEEFLSQHFQAGAVTTVTVQKHDAAKPVVVQRRADIVQNVYEDFGSERDGAGKIHVVGRNPGPNRWHEQDLREILFEVLGQARRYQDVNLKG